MAILIDCPRCKQSLSVPGKMAGGFAVCPRCNGQFQIPANAPNVPNRSGTVLPPSALPVTPPPVTVPPTAPSGPRTMPPAPPMAPPISGTSMRGPLLGSAASPVGPLPPPAAKPPPASMPAAAAPGAMGPFAQAAAMLKGDAGSAVAAVPSPQGGKVARFIAAEAAQSTLKPAEDGKLPELRLHESADGPRKEKARGSNPLLVMGVICLSLVMSIALYLTDLEPRDRTDADAKAHARAMVEEKFFSGLDRTPSERYQDYLRRAQRAYARGDYQTERNLYRKVLELLRAERPTGEYLTGGPTSDKELEQHLVTLLKE